MEKEAPKPLSERSFEELQTLLKELEATEADLIRLKADHPEIAVLENDMGLDMERYRIWQSIQNLQGVQFRITNVKLRLREKLIESQKTSPA